MSFSTAILALCWKDPVLEEGRGLALGCVPQGSCLPAPGHALIGHKRQVCWSLEKL